MTFVNIIALLGDWTDTLYRYLLLFGPFMGYIISNTIQWGGVVRQAKYRWLI